MPQGRLYKNVRLGVKNLLLHKLRSMLTMLGVVFGVGSVVAMLSIGEGASKETLEQIEKLGSNNIIINSMKPVAEESAGTMRQRLSVYGLLYDDADRIRDTVPGVDRIVPAKLIRKEGRLGGRALELRVVGTAPDWFEIVRRPVVAGRMLGPSDVQDFNNAVVLTETGARRLLATQSTIGQTLHIGTDAFQVVGIVRNAEEDSKKGQFSSSNLQLPDEDVDAYIPINVAKERFGDIVTRRSAGSMEREMVELHQLIVQVKDTNQVEAVANTLQGMFERFHKAKDYRMSVPLELLRQTERTKRTFNIVLGSIAGISLLVGGIGIMNIMLASVTERTREIGIRRAIGARRRQIVTQFLIETVVLSTVGGLVGIALGVLIPEVITRVSDMPTYVTAWSLVLSVGISMIVGIVFGLYPAVRAANLDPIVALRHE